MIAVILGSIKVFQGNCNVERERESEKERN